MPTIDELQARAEHLRSAELAALDALAAGMRELAVELPDGSRLALRLAEASQDLAKIVELNVKSGRSFDSWAGLRIDNFMAERMCEALAQYEEGKEE